MNVYKEQLSDKIQGKRDSADRATVKLQKIAHSLTSTFRMVFKVTQLLEGNYQALRPLSRIYTVMALSR